MTDIKQNTEKLIDFIGSKFENEELSNESLVQIIELCGSYLNLKTIADYAKDNSMSYNGVKNNRNVISLFGCKFVLEND